MKKLLTVFGIALVAMVLASGCKKEDPWKDCDKKATKIELTDGTWEAVDYGYMKYPASEDKDLAAAGITGDVESENEGSVKFTVADKKVNFVSGESSGYTKYPSGVNTSELEAYATFMNKMLGKDAYSVSGSKLKYSYELTGDELAAMYKMPKDCPVDSFTPVLEEDIDMDNLYTNEDGTKYIYKFEGKQGNAEVETKMTLRKL